MKEITSGAYQTRLLGTNIICIVFCKYEKPSHALYNCDNVCKSDNYHSFIDSSGLVYWFSSYVFNGAGMCLKRSQIYLPRNIMVRNTFEWGSTTSFHTLTSISQSQIKCCMSSCLPLNLGFSVLNCKHYKISPDFWASLQPSQLQ